MAPSLRAPLLIIGGYFFAFVVCRLFIARLRFRRLVKDGVPMPTWHPVFGHLKAMKENSLNLPRNASAHVSFTKLSKLFPSGVFYVDLYPFSAPVMVIFSPTLASQVESFDLTKPTDIYGKVDAITGGSSILTLHGGVWKTWRKIFSPGFSEGCMMGLASGIVQEVVVFCEILREMAREQQIFQLEESTLRLTFDVIGLTAFGKRLHYQTMENSLPVALRRQIEWTSYGTELNPLKRWFSIQPIVAWKCSRTINRYLHNEIDNYLSEPSKPSETSRSNPKSKSILAVAAEQYFAIAPIKGATSQESFKNEITPHLRALLFAGHDTTSTTFCFIIHMLHLHPEVRDRLRAEHDKVFGTEITSSQETIARTPLLLNQIPYTTAVIKETLRLYAPAAAMRQGRPDISLTDEDGNRYPTAGCNIWVLSLALQRNSNVWKDPDQFLPERWLVGLEDPIHAPKGGFRAFEQGPHACLGQPLAMLELKIALVMTVRGFEISPAYEEWDASRQRSGLKKVWGDRVYQSMRGGSGGHPDEGYPCRVIQRGK